MSEDVKVEQSSGNVFKMVSVFSRQQKSLMAPY